MDFAEFLMFCGLLHAMEVIPKLERHSHWTVKDNGLLPAGTFGKYMTRKRFENIVKYLSLSDDSKEIQIKKIINAVNDQWKQAFFLGMYK